MIRSECFNNFNQRDSNCLQVSPPLSSLIEIVQNTSSVYIKWINATKKNITYDVSFFINVRIGHEFRILDTEFRRDGLQISQRNSNIRVSNGIASYFEGVRNVHLNSNNFRTNNGMWNIVMFSANSCNSEIDANCNSCRLGCPLNYQKAVFSFTNDGFSTHMPIPIVSPHNCSVCTKSSGVTEYNYMTFHPPMNNYRIEIQFSSDRVITFARIHVYHLCTNNAGIIHVNVLSNGYSLQSANVTINEEFYVSAYIFSNKMSVQFYQVDNSHCNHGAFNIDPIYEDEQDGEQDDLLHGRATPIQELCANNASCVAASEHSKSFSGMLTLEQCRNAILTDTFCMRENQYPFMRILTHGHVRCACILPSQCLLPYAYEGAYLYSLDGMCYTNTKEKNLMQNSYAFNLTMIDSQHVSTRLKLKNISTLYSNHGTRYVLTLRRPFYFDALQYKIEYMSSNCDVQTHLLVGHLNEVGSHLEKVLYISANSFTFVIQNTDDNSVLNLYRSECRFKLSFRVFRRMDFSFPNLWTSILRYVDMNDTFTHTYDMSKSLFHNNFDARFWNVVENNWHSSLVNASDNLNTRNSYSPFQDLLHEANAVCNTISECREYKLVPFILHTHVQIQRKIIEYLSAYNLTHTIDYWLFTDRLRIINSKSVMTSQILEIMKDAFLSVMKWYREITYSVNVTLIDSQMSYTQSNIESRSNHLRNTTTHIFDNRNYNNLILFDALRHGTRVASVSPRLVASCNLVCDDVYETDDPETLRSWPNPGTQMCYSDESVCYSDADFCSMEGNMEGLCKVPHPNYEIQTSPGYDNFDSFNQRINVVVGQQYALEFQGLVTPSDGDQFKFVTQGENCNLCYCDHDACEAEVWTDYPEYDSCDDFCQGEYGSNDCDVSGHCPSCD